MAISFLSASQDIVIDAFRIEILDDKTQGAGVAMTQLGYRLGGIISGAGTSLFKRNTQLVWCIFSFISIYSIFSFNNYFIHQNKKK